MKSTRTRHGWVHMFIIHRPTVTLQLHNFDLFRTCRTTSFCTVAWQWQDFNWHDASCGPSAIAELLVFFRTDYVDSRTVYCYFWGYRFSAYNVQYEQNAVPGEKGASEVSSGWLWRPMMSHEQVVFTAVLQRVERRLVRAHLRTTTSRQSNLHERPRRFSRTYKSYRTHILDCRA